MKTLKFTCVSVGLGLAVMAGPSAFAADDIASAIEAGKVTLKARLRSESVDDGVNQNAEALTLGTKLGYTSGTYKRLFFTAERSDTSVVAGQGDYAPRAPGYAVVADPEVTEVNLAYLSYVGESFSTRAGRQRIIYDNARFVGNVGWRQNEQTFDALSFGISATPSLAIQYAYVDRVKGITPAFNADVSHHLVNANWKAGKPATLPFMVTCSSPTQLRPSRPQSESGTRAKPILSRSSLATVQNLRPTSLTQA